jgi:hypothetical protein
MGKTYMNSMSRALVCNGITAALSACRSFFNSLLPVYDKEKKHMKSIR